MDEKDVSQIVTALQARLQASGMVIVPQSLLMQPQRRGGGSRRVTNVTNVTQVLADHFYYDAVVDFGAPNDGATDAFPALQAMLDQMAQGESQGVKTYGYLPAGTYLVSQPPVQQGGEVFGQNLGTVVQVVPGGVGWRFGNPPSMFSRSTLKRLQIMSGINNATGTAPGGAIGLDLNESQRVDLEHIQVWDFALGILISDGTPFSGYHHLGEGMETIRCSVGVRMLANANSVEIDGIRVYWCFTDTDSGIGIDMADCHGVEIPWATIESCDLGVRVRNADTAAGRRTQIHGGTWYIEPSTNPVTATVGRDLDVLIQDYAGDLSGIEVFHVDNIFESANNGSVELPPEGLVHCNAMSSFFFGGRYDGASVPKANRCLNGDLSEWGIPTILPGWFTGGAAPTLIEETVVVYNSVRSLRAAATATSSSVSKSFRVSDPGAAYQTIGFAYQVGPGNTGFSVSASSGGNTANMVDDVPGAGFSNSAWRVRYLTVKVAPGVQTGALNFTIDGVGGAGEILVGGVWNVTGKFNAPYTAYEQKIKLLSAPIVIARNALDTGNEVYSVDVLTLPSNATLSAAEQDMATAPRGVVGVVLRLHVNVDEGAGNAPLANPYSIYLTVPAAGGVVAAVTEFYYPQFSERDHYWEAMVRLPISGATTVSGGYLQWVVGNPRVWDVALKAWILE